MNLPTKNLIASCATIPLWAIAYALSIAGVDSDAHELLKWTGLLIVILGSVNLMGIVIGIGTVIGNVTSLRGWFGFTIHFAQFFVTVGITYLGYFVQTAIFH